MHCQTQETDDKETLVTNTSLADLPGGSMVAQTQEWYDDKGKVIPGMNSMLTLEILDEDELGSESESDVSHLSAEYH